jgi:hypothetical protein
MGHNIFPVPSRDVEDMPESICPCHNNTMDLITEIIDQVTESICPCHNNTMDLITEIIDQVTDTRVLPHVC